MRDMLNNTQMVHLGSVVLSGTTAATSDYVDIRDFSSATIVVVANTITDAGTASGFTATFQESADTAGASAGTVAATAAVNGTTTLTETSDSADNTVIGSFGYNGGERYLGISAVGTTGTNADLSVYAVLQKPHRAPPTLVGTSVART
jgi:hypothetical protein